MKMPKVFLAQIWFSFYRSSSPKPQTPPEEVIEKAPPTATTEGTDTSQADAPAAAAASESKP